LPIAADARAAPPSPSSEASERSTVKITRFTTPEIFLSFGPQSLPRTGRPIDGGELSWARRGRLSGWASELALWQPMNSTAWPWSNFSGQNRVDGDSGPASSEVFDGSPIPRSTISTRCCRNRMEARDMAELVRVNSDDRDGVRANARRLVRQKRIFYTIIGIYLSLSIMWFDRRAGRRERLLVLLADARHWSGRRRHGGRSVWSRRSLVGGLGAASDREVCRATERPHIAGNRPEDAVTIRR
jgi:hypothetical protein